MVVTLSMLLIIQQTIFYNTLKTEKNYPEIWASMNIVNKQVKSLTAKWKRKGE